MTKNRIAKKHSITKYDVVFLVMLFALTAFSIWKAPRGYGGNDECFYLTIPYRFLQGDGLIVDEWHVSQLSGILLLPIMKLYQLLGGTGEGIILKFRYIYVVARALCGVCIYLILRGQGEKKNLCALCAAAVFLPYAPIYIMALSYNSMGIMALILSGLLLATANNKIYKQVIAGVLYAFSVLCCPYLIVIYLLYSVVLLIKYIRYKRQSKKDCAKTLAKAWGYFTLSAAIVALLLVVYILAKGNITRLAASVSGIFSDPQHEPLVLGEKIRIYAKYLFTEPIHILAGAILVSILIIMRSVDKHWKKRRWLYLTISSLYTICFAWRLSKLSTVEFINTALTVGGLCAYIMTEHRDKRVFWFVYIPGWLYSFLLHLGSNTHIYCITSALNVASVAGAYFAGCAALELWEDKKWLNCAAACVMILSVLMQSGLITKGHYEGSYAGFANRMTDENWTLYCEVEEGPFKGLRIAEDEYHKYNDFIESAESVRNAEGESVLYYAHYPWLYLADEKDNASFSAWMSLNTNDSAIERLLMYWDINPEKIPDVIFIDKDAVGADRAVIELNIADYTVTETDAAYMLTR